MIFDRYASYYDAFYKTKRYDKECKFLETLFARYMSYRPKTILDLGCGTGNHMIPLLKRGYQVTGADSSPAMLTIAQEKINKAGEQAELIRASLQSFDRRRKFDVIICMFSVMDYIIKDQHLKNTFQNVMRHMKKSSLFIFDFWNTSAVENYYSPQKRQIFHEGNKTIERSSITRIKPIKNICEVQYTCRMKENGHWQKSFKERHVVRYFTIREIISLLLQAKMKILVFCPFMNLYGKIRKSTWDITVVAQKIN